MYVSLISLNSKYVHASLSVWYLKESVRHAGPDMSATVLEGTINQSAEDILSRITAGKPDVLAFSCYIWNISQIQTLLPLIKKSLPSVQIVLGGPEVSYNAEEVLSGSPEADYVIAGEGELPFPILLSALSNKGDVSGVPGLCYRNGGATICNPPSPPLAEPPSPYSKEYLGSLSGRIAYLETSRGCPFSCAFCLSGGPGANVRFFGMQRAKKDLLLLANSGAQTVKLVDRTFNCNQQRAYGLFDFIIKNVGTAIPSGVCFHFEVAADLFDDKTLRLLAGAPPGLIQLEVGIQSFNPQTLASVMRKTDIIKVEKAIRTILSAGNIHLHADLIAGLPYEGLVSFASSFDRAFALRPHMLQLGFLKLLHGSKLRSQAQETEYRYASTPPYEVISSPWLSADDIRLLRQTEYALGKLYNSGRFSLTIEYVLKATGKRPFGLFGEIGGALLNIPLSDRRSLDTLTRQAFGLLAALPGVGKAELRDALVCDRIACGQKIPEFLKIPDPEYKKILTHIRNIGFAGKKNEKINAALLYAGDRRAVFARTEKDPVTGRFSLCFI